VAAKSLRGISQKSISLLDTAEAYLYLMRLSQSLMGSAGCNLWSDKSVSSRQPRFIKEM
jgi:hypothetical protein